MNAKFNNDPELVRLHLDQMHRLAAITAELGIPGDEPIEKILAHIRRLRNSARNEEQLFSEAKQKTNP